MAVRTTHETLCYLPRDRLPIATADHLADFHNVLYWRERPVIIDFSQTVDSITHPGARELLRRDLEQLTTYFRRHGLDTDVDRTWRRIRADRLLEGRA